MKAKFPGNSCFIKADKKEKISPRDKGVEQCVSNRKGKKVCLNSNLQGKQTKKNKNNFQIKFPQKLETKDSNKMQMQAKKQISPSRNSRQIQPSQTDNSKKIIVNHQVENPFPTARNDVELRESDTGSHPSMRRSSLRYIEPKVFDPLDQSDLDESFEDIQKIITETKEREERIVSRLGELKKKAKLVADNYEPKYRSEDSLKVKEKLFKYENQLNSFKDTMENIFNLTKETSREVKKTKTIISNLQSEGGSNNKQNDTYLNHLYHDIEEAYPNGFKITEEDERETTARLHKLPQLPGDDKSFQPNFTTDDGTEMPSPQKKAIDKQIKEYEKLIAEKMEEKKKRDEETFIIQQKLVELCEIQKTGKKMIPIHIRTSSLGNSDIPNCASCSNTEKETCTIFQQVN